LVAKDCAKGSEKGPIGFYKKQYSKWPLHRAWNYEYRTSASSLD
jgi:hypothetical protein